MLRGDWIDEPGLIPAAARVLIERAILIKTQNYTYRDFAGTRVAWGTPVDWLLETQMALEELQAYIDELVRRRTR